MTNTQTNTAEVIKKGNTYYFMNDGEIIARLGVITYTFREKLRKDLKKMKWYNPREDFKKTDLEVPKSGDTKELNKFIRERDSLAMWSPVLAYMKADDKDLVAKRFCSEFMQMEEVPKPFIDKMHHILSDFTEILEKHLNHANEN